MPNTIVLAIGLRLRDARLRRGLSLNSVEDGSRGEFKASCVGAYERGERVIPSDRLVKLAAFYGRPAWEMLP